MRRCLCVFTVLLASAVGRAPAQDLDARYQGQTVAEWLRRLGDDDWSVRCGAAYALGEIGPPARVAVPGLALALKYDAHPRVRAAAARALGKIGVDARSAAFALVEALTDKNREVREAATPAAVQPLIGALQKGDLDIQIRACRALGHIGPPAKAAVPALKALLPDSFVRAAALDALNKIDPGATLRLNER
jgi:HEAT repeat protein